MPPLAKLTLSSS
jgi:hypothetical protein